MTATATDSVVTPAQKDARFPCFDGLRAIAACSVVVYHTVTHYNVFTTEFATWEWINRLGNFGVSTFFLISGFLLYRPFVLSHFRDEPRPNLGVFWQRRFFRIFPAYWVVFTVAWILGFAPVSDISGFFTGYLLLHNYRFGYQLYGLGVEWTLVIEVSFYLALPFFALVLRKLSPPGASLERKLRGQLYGLLGMYVIAMGARIYSLWVVEAVPHHRGDWFPASQMTSWLIGYLDWFAAGMLLAVGSAWIAMGKKLPWVGRLLADHPWACWLLAFECYWVALKLNLPVSVFEKVTRIQSFGISFVYALVAFLLIYPAVFGNQEQGRIRGFLRHPAMVWLGTISYGIYLWHIVYVKEVENWTRDGIFSANLFVWLAVVFTLVIITAAASYYLLERPVIRWAHRNPFTFGAAPPRPRQTESQGPSASAALAAEPKAKPKATRAPKPPRPREPFDWRREARAFIELFALCGIAIVQPILDLLGKNTGIFVQRETTGVQLVALVLVIALIPPLVLYGIEAVFGWMLPSSRRWVHAVLGALVIGVAAIEVVKKATELGPSALLIGGAIVGIGGGALLLLVAGFRQFLRYLALAVPVFMVMFLFASPATGVVFSDDASAALKVGFTSPHRVVLVVMDEFPEMSLLDGTGHIDRELYPNYAALADASTWYRNESTVAPYTGLAVPAILTGRYPPKPDAVATSADYPESLFTLLGDAYKMNVHEDVTQMCPQKICPEARSTDTGFSGLVSETASLWQDFASPNRTEFSFNEAAGTTRALKLTRDFTRSLKHESRSQLDFAHIELPHNPWHYLPDLRDSEATGAMNGAKYLAWTDPVSARSAQQRHLLQVQATDTLLGDMMKKLKATGDFDNTMFILTADHGVSFQNGEPLRSVSQKNYPEIMWTPLFIKYPGQKTGKIDDRHAESIDVLPTIADVLGAKIPWKVDGQSLRGTPRTEGARRIYQWGEHALEPPTALKPPAGKQYLEFDGTKGFERVREHRAVKPGPDPTLRIYRDAEYGDLIGKDAAPFVKDLPTNEKSAIDDRLVIDSARTDTAKAPWAYGEGYFNDVDRDHPIAISLNGKIAAVATARVFRENKHNAFFTYIVPPQLVRDGKNNPVVYIIRGSPKDPQLDPVWLHP